MLVSTFYELYITLSWIWNTKRRFDVYIGVDNLNAFHGLVLKFFGRVKKVIYYTIDYFPTRFENVWLNKIYHALDKFCVRWADETWNVSAVMAQAREKYNHMDRHIYNRQHTVPIGIWYDKAPRKPFNKIDIHKLVFVGHLLPHMGVDLAIEALPIIRKKISNITLLIIGGGIEETHLKKSVHNLGISEAVRFYGWIRDRKNLERIMSDGAIGLATFNTTILDDKVRNADPGKIKDYMLLGMPVITTNAISTAEEIQKRKCGIVIRYNKEELASAVVQLLGNLKQLQEYRTNALTYVRQFDYGHIFKTNMERILL
jgi:glycosyltransferase involved in cell wall biosynthesis